MWFSVRVSIGLLLITSSVVASAETLLVVGDSLSAAYGLPSPSLGWVHLLAEDLKPHSVKVVNASISGDTTAGGLQRLEPLLAKHHPDLVVIELGANDGLRGLPPSETETHLRQMIEAIKAKGSQVLLLGIRIPPNYGKRFTDLFQSLYPKLAHETGSGLVAFFLEGVGGHDDMMQADGLHPNEKAQPILKSNVLLGLKTIGMGLDSTRQAPRQR